MAKLILEQEFLDNFTSPHTRRSYENDLNQFIDFIQSCYPHIDSFTKVEREHIIRYRNVLAEVGGIHGETMAPKSLARKLSGLASYFDFLIEEKHLSLINPVDSVKRPRLEVKNPTKALSIEQVRELFNEVEKNKTSGPLHKALFILLFTSGLRKSEVLFLKRQDFKPQGEHVIIEYRGKGGKLRAKVVHPLAVAAINDYLLWMKGLKREHGPKDWLFQPTRNRHNPNELNRPLNPMTLNQLFKKYAAKIGLNFTISPHSARATFISSLLDKGVPITDVAREVAHSSVKTTQEYDKRREDLNRNLAYKIDY